MREWPRDAIKTKEELLEFCDKQNGKPFTFYLLEADLSIIKRKLSKPWIEESKHISNKCVLADGFRRYLSSIGLEEPIHGYDIPNSFMFLNYWDAFAHACRLKEGANA
jgi:hypothetical protein